MRFAPHVLAIGFASLIACSVVNAPDDPKPANSDDGPGGATAEGCPEGYEVCGGACVTTDNDPAHCGGCDEACEDDEVCGVGQCLSDCPDGTVACGGSCVDLQSDAAHCGGCDEACPAGNGTATCSDGMCALACADGFEDCDGNADNGCELDLRDDPQNCGACGKVCLALANSVATCSAGSCGLGACDTGFEDCDNVATNGCEAQLDRDPNNCLGCGNACMGATPSCINGCSTAIWQVGVQQNMSLNALTSSGWQVCLAENFGGSGANLSDTFNNNCTGQALMYACRVTGSNTLQLSAMAYREDVLTDCAQGVNMCGGASNCTTEANGVGWYFSENWSLGFVQGADPVDRCSCDTDTTSRPDLRMCIHTNSGSLGTGYRCGSNTNAGLTHERLILHIP